MNDLSAIRSTLSVSLGHTELVMLSMRVMLETGVSLLKFRPDQDRDQQCVARVKKALVEMKVPL